MTRPFANTRRVLCAGLLCAAALYFAPPARSQSCDQPVNAGIDQYCDPLDPPPGAHRNPSGPGPRIPKSTREALSHGSNSAQGALALSRIRGVADPIGPARVARPGAAPGAAPRAPSAAAASESGPTAGGGFVALMVVLALGLATTAWLARRRRSSR